MSAYVLTAVSVTDDEAFAGYARAAGPSLDQHGVEVLATCDDPVVLEGEPLADRYVLLRFADRDAARAWYDSASYRASIPMRHASATTPLMVIVDGGAS